MRLIDADEFYKILSKEASHKILHSKGSQFDVGRTNGIIYARDMIKNTPSIEPVKRGKWADTPTGLEIKRCSICNEKFRIKDTHIANFCPNCGADMRAQP